MARALIKNPLLLGYVDEPIKSDDSIGTDYTVSKIGGTPVRVIFNESFETVQVQYGTIEKKRLRGRNRIFLIK